MALNVRIMFEVEHLRYATLATVSRCGMIWFSEDVYRALHDLSQLSGNPLYCSLDADDEDTLELPGRRIDQTAEAGASANLVTQKVVAQILERYFADGELVSAALTFAESIEHIMDFTVTRAPNTLFSLINKTAKHH